MEAGQCVYRKAVEDHQMKGHILKVYRSARRELGVYFEFYNQRGAEKSKSISLPPHSKLLILYFLSFVKPVFEEIFFRHPFTLHLLKRHLPELLHFLYPHQKFIIPLIIFGRPYSFFL
jgi:hypothetical protein